MNALSNYRYSRECLSTGQRQSWRSEDSGRLISFFWKRKKKKGKNIYGTEQANVDDLDMRKNVTRKYKMSESTSKFQKKEDWVSETKFWLHGGKKKKIPSLTKMESEAEHFYYWTTQWGKLFSRQETQFFLGYNQLLERTSTFKRNKRGDSGSKWRKVTPP